MFGLGFKITVDALWVTIFEYDLPFFHNYCSKSTVLVRVEPSLADSSHKRTPNHV